MGRGKKRASSCLGSLELQNIPYSGFGDSQANDTDLCNKVRVIEHV